MMVLYNIELCNFVFNGVAMETENVPTENLYNEHSFKSEKSKFNSMKVRGHEVLVHTEN